jgi:hypothetical protein
VLIPQVIGLLYRDPIGQSIGGIGGLATRLVLKILDGIARNFLRMKFAAQA